MPLVLLEKLLLLLELLLLLLCSHSCVLLPVVSLLLLLGECMGQSVGIALVHPPIHAQPHVLEAVIACGDVQGALGGKALQEMLVAPVDAVPQSHPLLVR